MAEGRHLLIDGANVVRAWPELQRLYLRDRESSRERLLTQARRWHDETGWRVSVVFDGRGREVQFERDGHDPGWVVIRTPDHLTGDDVIERLVAGDATPAACVVVTADEALKQTVRAAGGETVSPTEFARWLEESAAQVERRQTRRSRKVDLDWRSA